MKKLAVFAVAAVMAVAAFAQEADHYGWYDTSITIGGKTYDFGGWAAYDQSPSDLGYLTDLTVTAVSFKAWNTEDQMGGANMFFRIWDGGTQVGTDQDQWLGTATRIGDPHDYSISWTGSKDLATDTGLNLVEGKTYYVDMWAKTYGTGNQGDPNGDEWYSGKDGQNYHTQFTYGTAPTPAVPEPATMSLLGLGALAMVLRRKLRK